LETASRYPNQNLTASLPGITSDLEILAGRFGFSQVEIAIKELRITPGQKFFPHPSEVAEEIQRAQARKKSQPHNGRTEFIPCEVEGCEDGIRVGPGGAKDCTCLNKWRIENGIELPQPPSQWSRSWRGGRAERFARAFPQAAFENRKFVRNLFAFHVGEKPV
jgi:hypothetical protein